MADPERLLLGLLLAHLATDFLFQPDGWVKAKEDRGFASGVLLLHSAVAGGLAALMSMGALNPVCAFIVTTASHWVIDGLKACFGKDRTRWLLADQALHLAVICGLVWWGSPGTPLSPGLEPLWLSTLGSGAVRVWGCGLLLVGIPGSLAVKTMIGIWDIGKGEEAGSGAAEGPREGKDDGVQGRKNAGKWIGILERLFILIFILGGHWEGIGFLVVAKSILRFGEIKDSADRERAEYVLVGTLASYLWAVAVSMAAEALLPPLY
ncbi:MAG: DUF3307 domain-containing protein [Pseudodesulfovibrio sp.]|uniref:DUF3307 domain-containing protein n=1 Tax=Pseudodesulfovibrio sp. TaxID=2035812 RepID=UPI003D0D6368